MQPAGHIYVGCAGWSIPKLFTDWFPPSGSHLQRYAARFPAVEINTTFYRLHRPDTFARWAASVPQEFRFSIKLPREITHAGRLEDLTLLDEFLARISTLEERLGPLLVQLPPSLRFREHVASIFFRSLRDRFPGQVVCEPRHVSWFAAQVDRLLADFRVARVAADPARVPQAGQPGGWVGLVYYRLHGSPRMYYSAYSPEYLAGIVQLLHAQARYTPVWCIFDNTAEGAATANALDLLAMLEKRSTS